MIETIPTYNHTNDQHYLVKVNKNFKCVCQLCSCGKHKCPRQQIKGQFDTAYTDHYKNFTIVPQIIKPRYHYQQRHYNPQSLRSNYQQTYTQKEQAPTNSISRLQNVGRVVLKSGPFISDTSYKDEYKPFKIQADVQQPVYNLNGSLQKLNQSRERSPIKFEGQSSYKSSYQSVPIPKIDRYKYPEYKNTTPFVGSSSYKNQFTNFKVQPVFETSPQNSGGKKIKFEGASTYNNHYKSFEVRPIPKVATICELDKLKIPPTNYINNKQHIYYDHNTKQFI